MNVDYKQFYLLGYSVYSKAPHVVQRASGGFLVEAPHHIQASVSLQFCAIFILERNKNGMRL